MVPVTEIRCAVEFRADEDRTGPGRLRGVLLTYGEPRADRREVFRAGSLEWPADGIVLRRQHSRFEPVTRVVPEVRGDRVVLDVALPDTRAGRDAAAEVRGGLFRGLSVEFKAREEGRTAGGLREIRRALLVGAGLVDSPAYRGSRVEVRAEGAAAVAVDVALDDVARHLVGKGAADLGDGERSGVTEARQMALDQVSAYVRGSTLPESVERSAVLRLAYYDYHARLARRPADGGMLDARFRRDAPLSPLRASGAMALLSPFKRRSVGVAS